MHTSTKAPSLASPATTSPELVAWQDIDLRAAGALILLLNEEERSTVDSIDHSASQMWESLLKRHVQTKAQSRFNEYSSFFALQLKEGEKLASLAVRIEEGMRRSQAHCPKAMTIEELDKELIIMGIFCALSATPSCPVLVTPLLHNDSIPLPTVRNDLVTEDISRERNPAMYGLEATPEGILLAQGVIATHLAVANAASSGLSQGGGSKDKARGAGGSNAGGRGAKQGVQCAFCKRTGHEEATCFLKRLDNMEKHATSQSARVVLAPHGFNPAAELAKAADTAGFRQSPSILDNTDSNWIADTGATSHMTPHRFYFESYAPLRIPICLADGNTIYSAGVGSVIFMPIIEGLPQRSVEFTCVLHVPQLQVNLVEVCIQSMFM
jgi:hypothetical protein